MVKVLDFGIAKLIGESVVSQRLTVEGSLVGTPAYMAPERLTDSSYDGRADVYSLGIMLYEMLAGRRPFTCVDLLELIRLHVHEPPRPLSELCPDLPRGIDAVVLRALAKDPKSRPTAEELARDFRAALAEPVAGGQGSRDGRAGAGSAAPPSVGAPQAGRQEGEDRTATERWAVTLPESERAVGPAVAGARKGDATGAEGPGEGYGGRGGDWPAVARNRRRASPQRAAPATRHRRRGNRHLGVGLAVR